MASGKLLAPGPIAVCEALQCLARLLLGELDGVVPEVYPDIQQAKGASHLLGLLSDEVSLHLLTAEVGRPMVVDRLGVCRPLHNLLFLS